MSKRIRTIILCTVAVIAMFIPTYIAIANYATLGSWQNTLTGDMTVITVKNEDGGIVFSGRAGEKSNLDLARSLADMLENGKPLRAAPTVSSDRYHTVTARIGSRERNYYCYYIPDGEESYLFDVESNVCYAIAGTEMLPFLQSTFYGETHETLSVPTLTTAGNEIIPTYVSWYHKNNQDNYNPIMELATVSEEETYAVNKNISLRFDPVPDVATVRIYSGSEELYNGSMENFKGLSYEDSITLTVAVQAKWEQRAERDFYGEASYQFYISYSATPVFAISADRATVGDYIAVNVLNAADPDSISFTSTPDLGCKPTFYEDGDYVRALVPLSAELTPGVYQITVSTKGAEETFELTLEERSTLSRTYDAGSELINRARNTTAIAEYEALRREIANTQSTTKYFSGKFIDYRESSSVGAIILLGYGHTRTLTSGATYRMDGVDFMIYQGTDVPALNNGMVIASGQSAYLGNYVIVDHGLGLRTWYCHLSEISVSVGDTVKSAQAIGRSGSTGFTTGSGVYLICTIGDTAISPYTLWSDGVVYE
jgi:murein DD-endopeptidase MepM/ murein hydrolase activator NlpD